MTRPTLQIPDVKPSTYLIKNRSMTKPVSITTPAYAPWLSSFHMKEMTIVAGTGKEKRK